MYKNLKFSWSHIIAFLALICIGYVSFVGLTYYIDDGFVKSSIATAVILVVLIIWFIGAQQLKGIDNDFNFAKCIWWERILLFTTPIIFIVCIFPFNHAMNVASKAEYIEETFKSTISSSEKMFEDYAVYRDQRVANYRMRLDSLAIKDLDIDLEVDMLNRQLSDGYNQLDEVARAWRDKVDQEASVWNVFLVGNLDQIEASINMWSSDLTNFSSVILSTEASGAEEVLPFDADRDHLEGIKANLNGLRLVYKPAEDDLVVNKFTIIYGILLYLCLLFPYFIQMRNGVSTYKLFGRRFMNQGIDITKVDDNVIQPSAPTTPMQPAERIDVQSSGATFGSEYGAYEFKSAASNSSNGDMSHLSKEDRIRIREERRRAREARGDKE